MKDTDNLLRENSHDRDISEIVATITALDRPSPSLLRFTAFVPGSAKQPSVGRSQRGNQALPQRRIRRRHPCLHRPIL